MYGDPEPLTALVLAGLLAWAYLQDYLEDDPDPLEELKEMRVEGEISQSEYERRLDVMLDEEADRIRECVEPVPGIGPETSRYIASRYESVDELHRADVDELQELPGVGEKRAKAIEERLR